MCADCCSVGSVREGAAERGKVDVDSVGAQHVGTGMGLGGIKGRSGRGNNLKDAVRRREAVVNVMAKATVKTS